MNPGNWIARNAGLTPDKAAIRFPGREISYAQLAQQVDRLAAGSTVRNLNIDLAKRVLVPIPPLAEQRRIVAILDEAFEGIATAKANAAASLSTCCASCA